MTRTKKVGSAGRFGARYGKNIRKKIILIEKKQKAKAKCPYCSKMKVGRLFKGVWQCKKCLIKFTGKAYELS